jgi:hypothetical protein
MMNYDPFLFGRSLRDYRRKLGWSATQLATLYAEFVGREDFPPDPTFIYHIERGATRINQERRAIFASLVGMPLALIGRTELDHSMPLDIPAYTQALALYCEQFREGPLKQEIGAIQQRIDHLQRASLQAYAAEKSQLLKLSGFYQIILAQVMSEQPAITSALLSSPIERAKEEHFSALHAYARIVRAGLAMHQFESTLNCNVLHAARRDIHAALAACRREPGNI